MAVVEDLVRNLDRYIQLTGKLSGGPNQAATTVLNQCRSAILESYPSPASSIGMFAATTRLPHSEGDDPSLSLLPRGNRF